MDKTKLSELFEKVYFHEMEVRDKIAGRVQINFGLVAAGYAITCYMLRNIKFSIDSLMSILFCFLLLASIICSVVCLNYLVKAFWGNEYMGMPSARDIDDYRLNLFNYNSALKEYNLEHDLQEQSESNIEEKVADFIYSNFRDCSSHNTNVNDRRSANLHTSFKWILFSGLPFILAGIIFIAFDLDISSPRNAQVKQDDKKTLQEINFNLSINRSCNPILQEQTTLMSETKKMPPPPPPSPPIQPKPRQVIENVQPKRIM